MQKRTEPSIEQIRSFRLRAHHLDAVYPKEQMVEIVGACGMQNTPPGAWETALFNRAADCSQAQMEQLLYQDKTLLQAFSLRGAPMVFPTAESSTFLTALCPEGEEPWIYTDGIRLALDFLQMEFTEVFAILQQVIPGLESMEIVSKTALDQTLAEWMLPLLPAEKRDLWKAQSMYTTSDKQTVGGAVVSFLLRPCAFLGQVVFGERKGISPVFTACQSWTGHGMQADPEAGQRLVRKFLHCYGPASTEAFEQWLGCSRQQARRLWNSTAEEMEPVTVLGKRAWLLSKDKEKLWAEPSFERELLLLGGHDPYLDQRDRLILQPEKGLHKQIWRTVANPGAVVYRGEVIGIWTPRKKSKAIEMEITLWKQKEQRRKAEELAEAYAAFRGEKGQII